LLSFLTALYWFGSVNHTSSHLGLEIPNEFGQAHQ
jgi:hypothetical protein